MTENFRKRSDIHPLCSTAAPAFRCRSICYVNLSAKHRPRPQSFTIYSALSVMPPAACRFVCRNRELFGIRFQAQKSAPALLPSSRFHRCFCHPQKHPGKSRLKVSSPRPICIYIHIWWIIIYMSFYPNQPHFRHKSPSNCEKRKKLLRKDWKIPLSGVYCDA